MVYDGDGVRYGCEEKDRGFYIITNFAEKNYHYFERHGEFTFNRRWGKAERDGLTWVEYRNLAFYTAPNRTDCWRFFVYDDEKNFVVRKGKLVIEYYFFSKESSESEDELREEIALPGFYKKMQLEKPKEKIPEIQKRVMDDVLRNNTKLYQKIHNKERFLEELKGHYFHDPDTINGNETEEDIKNLIAEGEELFTNFIKTEALDSFKRNISTEILLSEFSELKACFELEDANLVDINEIIELSKETDEATIYEYSLQDWVDETVNWIQNAIVLEKTKNKVNQYDVNFILEKYQEKIDRIQRKDVFVNKLAEELCYLSKLNFYESTCYFENVERFIERYIKDELREFGPIKFIEKYGCDKVTVYLTDLKKQAFEEKSKNYAFSSEEQKEYEIYQELKETFASVAYTKKGTRLNPGLTVAHQLIEKMKKARDDALQREIIKWDGEKYSVAQLSKRKINDFAEKISEK